MRSAVSCGLVVSVLEGPGYTAHCVSMVACLWWSMYVLQGSTVREAACFVVVRT